MGNENFKDIGLEKNQIIRDWVEGKREIVRIYDTKGDRDKAPSTVIEPITIWGEFLSTLDSPRMYTDPKQLEEALLERRISEDKARLANALLESGMFVCASGSIEWRGYRLGGMPRFERR